MIAYSYIEKNLSSLDKKYRLTKSNTEARYYSKLATLELCGWIETSIDDSILRCANRLLKSRSARKIVEKEVKRTYGFEYERHFRSLIITLIGIHGFEKVEMCIEPSVLSNFMSALGSLKISRDMLAHTYTKGATSHYDAPSLTLGLYYNVKAGISAYDRALRELY